jgi:trehalose 6-phosphate synthase
MQLCDVLLVNPIIDGMNLVAKEGATVNERDGVLVLSEGAGAAEQLGPHALLVSPTDIIGTMAALHAALQMPAPERHERANALREQVAREDLSMWLIHQFRDIYEFDSRAEQEIAGFNSRTEQEIAGTMAEHGA